MREWDSEEYRAEVSKQYGAAIDRLFPPVQHSAVVRVSETMAWSWVCESCADEDDATGPFEACVGSAAHNMLWHASEQPGVGA